MTTSGEIIDYPILRLWHPIPVIAEGGHSIAASLHLTIATPTNPFQVRQRSHTIGSLAIIPLLPGCEESNQSNSNLQIEMECSLD